MVVTSHELTVKLQCASERGLPVFRSHFLTGLMAENS